MNPTGNPRDEELQSELAATDANDSNEAEAAFQQFTDEELEHFVTLSCERQRTAEYDMKSMSEGYKDVIKLEKERREQLLNHLRTRRSANEQAQNLVKHGTGVQTVSMMGR